MTPSKDEIPLHAVAIRQRAPRRPGIYLILQSREYPRYRGKTRILKIGRSGRDLQAELLNHTGRHIVANRIKRIAGQLGLALTFWFEETSSADAKPRERGLLQRFEDEFWDLPVLNAQRGYRREEDSHYAGQFGPRSPTKPGPVTSS
jgi:hypothetical protein